MSAVIPPQRFTLPRPTAVPALVALTVVVVGALAAWIGVRIGHVATPTHSGPPPAHVVSVGAARLAVPGDWRPVPLRKTGIAGLDARSAVAFETVPGMSVWAVAAFSPTIEPSLIPPELGGQLRGAPTPAGTRLAGWPTWTYRDVTVGRAGPQADVTVLPTTEGVLAVACTTPAESVVGASCASDVEAVAVRGATPLVPSGSLALELRLPSVLDALNRARLEHRASLSAARTHTAQALAAARLAAAHRVAARAVGGMAGPAGAPLLHDLSETASAYEGLRRAAHAASPAAFAAARGAVRAAETELAAGVRDVPRPTAVRVPRSGGPAPASPAATEPASGGVPPLAFVLLMLLAGAAGVATGVSDPVRLWRGAVRRGMRSSPAEW
jgi:hypothetical protein